MANVDLRNLRYDSAAGYGNPSQSYVRYDSGAITRGRHARRLRYKIMSARMDFCLFHSPQKIPDNRSRERLNGFS